MELIKIHQHVELDVWDPTAQTDRKSELNRARYQGLKFSTFFSAARILEHGILTVAHGGPAELQLATSTAWTARRCRNSHSVSRGVKTARNVSLCSPQPSHQTPSPPPPVHRLLHTCGRQPPHRHQQAHIPTTTAPSIPAPSVSLSVPWSGSYSSSSSFCSNRARGRPSANRLSLHGLNINGRFPDFYSSREVDSYPAGTVGEASGCKSKGYKEMLQRYGITRLEVGVDRSLSYSEPVLDQKANAERSVPKFFN